MKAKKTKSGKWRVTIYDYKDSTGKVHQKTFTAETKKEAVRLANEYKGSSVISDPTVGEAVKSYIDLKEATLSPPTVRAYRSIYRTHFKTTYFGSMQLSALDTTIMQRFVSDLVTDGKSPKTVKNIYGLLCSSVVMFRPGAAFAVTLPATKKPELYTPTKKEVEKLIGAIKDDRELYLCVLLCAFGPMRRSEACAVMYSDVEGNRITVRRSCVKSDSGAWVYKDMPKNYSSYRTIIYPKEVIDEIGLGIGYLINKSCPNAISDRFTKALADAGLPHFRLHDLRHYSASILHAIGIPDQYIMARGGWKTDYVMKRVYRGTMTDVEKEMNDKINNYFGKSFREA